MPLERFELDRARALDAQDPAANYCTVATVDGNGQPQLRTLILRKVGSDFALFVNATSPKWQQMHSDIAVLTYWPSIQVQYRWSASTEPVAQSIVAQSWAMRPDPPKRMDWYYASKAAQSSDAGTRTALLDHLAALRLPDPLTAPAEARGLILRPYAIERLDLTQDNGVHDRTLYTLEADTPSQGAAKTWRATTLVP